MSLLKIENLSIGFKEKQKILFTNIHANVQSGTITALMGVNGVGKSCFLKTLGNLIPKIDGELYLNDRNYETFEAIEFAKMVALVLTEQFHVDYLRVIELVSMGRSPHTNWLGKLENNDYEVVKLVMDQIGIWNLSERFFSELSDGQKQKVLIARALAQGPDLLILDEPTTYLDIPSKIELIKLLKKIAKSNNMAVIMSTHDLELIKKEVDNVWLMGADESFSIGKPEELDSSGLFRKHFFLELD